MSSRESRAIVRGSAQDRSHSKEKDPPLMSEAPLRILLLGKSASESSRVGNSILGRSALDSEAPPDVVERVGGRVKDRHVTLINSPHLLQTDISEHQITQTLRECVSLSDPGPHVVVLVLNPPCSAGDGERLEQLRDSLSDGLFQHSLVISTREPTDTDEVLQEILQRCSHRHFSLQTSSSPEEILQMCEEIQRSNGGRHLECVQHQEDEKRREEEQKLKQERERWKREKEDLQSKHEEEENKMKILMEEMNREREEKIKRHEEEINRMKKMLEEEQQNQEKQRKRREEEFREREEQYKRVIKEREEMESKMHENVKWERIQWEKQKSELQKKQPVQETKSSVIHDTTKLNFVLLGTKQAGKSASGNTILGREAFESRRSSRSVTRDVAVESGAVNGFPVTVYDTPGLSEMSKKEIQQMISHKVLHECESCLCVFLLVISTDRFTEEGQKTVQKIEKILGEKYLEKTWILFTRGDELEEENSKIEELIEGNEQLKTLVQKYKQRYHVFNNRKRGSSDQAKLLLAKTLKRSMELITSDIPDSQSAHRPKQEEEEKIQREKEKRQEEERLKEEVNRRQRKQRKQDEKRACVCS